MSIKENIIRTLSQSKMLLKKHSPEILCGVAIVSTLAAVGTAVKATMQVDNILMEHNERRAKIEDGKKLVQSGEIPEGDYTEEMQRKDLVICYTKTALEFAREYWPCAAFTALSVASTFGMYKVLSARYVAAVAAYTSAQTAFKKYREVIREKFPGEDSEGQNLVDKEAMETVAEKLVKKDEEGKELSRRQGPCGLGYSMYARWFDETSVYWKKDGKKNLLFLRSQQNYANDLLKIHGHVTLNEVYDMLGLPRTREGSIVGWAYGKPGCIGYIDFGIYNGENQTARDFLNMWEKAIILDFNVDGVIYDYI